DREAVEAGRTDAHGVAGAGDRTVGDVGGGEGPAAGRLEGGTEGADAVGQGAVARQHGLAVGAAELGGGAVTRARVVERVRRRHREAEGRARRGGGGGADGEVVGGGGDDRDGVAGAGEAVGGGVVRR